MQRRCFQLVKFTIDSECLRAVLFPDIYDGFRKPWFYEGTNISKKASVLGDMPNRCVVLVESYIPLHESLSPVNLSQNIERSICCRQSCSDSL